MPCTPGRILAEPDVLQTILAEAAVARHGPIMGHFYRDREQKTLVANSMHLSGADSDSIHICRALRVCLPGAFPPKIIKKEPATAENDNFLWWGQRFETHESACAVLW